MDKRKSSLDKYKTTLTEQDVALTDAFPEMAKEIDAALRSAGIGPATPATDYDAVMQICDPGPLVLVWFLPKFIHTLIRWLTGYSLVKKINPKGIVIKIDNPDGSMDIYTAPDISYHWRKRG